MRFNINLAVNGKDAVREVSVDMEELRRAVDGVKTSAAAATGSFIRFNQHLEAIRNVSDIVQQMTDMLNSVTEEARSFSEAMSAANTMAGKSGQDFERLKDQVGALSKEIPVARDLLANGLYQTISNGVPEDNWLTFLEKSAKASVGGLANLEEVVKVTSTVIKNYGLSWEDAGDIQDKIQLTAKYGVTSFEQMAQALPRVTANAATLGVTVNELMSVFATLTGVSGNTAEVSTQLAAVFTALVKPSSEATEMAQRMGVQFDAAAVQAAGGIQQFIKGLDQSVKSFASSSGMLEQEIYGKLFGSAESLRALIPLTGELADKFDENVAAMEGSSGTIDEAFGIMADTATSKIQLINNKLGDFSDVLYASVGNALPYANFAAQATMAMAAAYQLSIAFKGLGLGAKLASAATAAFGPILQVVRSQMAGATVSAQTLRLAMRSLMIVTGVGIAVVALAEAINLLCGSTDTAAGRVKELSESEESYRRSAAEVKSAIDNEVRKLRDLISTKKDASEETRHLNATYGDIFGTYKTAAEWYDVLTRKSQSYVKQVGYEAQAKVLATQLAEKQIQLEANFAERRELWANGGAQVKRRVSIGSTTTGGFSKSEEYWEDTDEYAALKDEARGLIADIDNLNTKLGIAQDGIKKYASEMQSVTAEGKKTLSVAEMNRAQVVKALEETETKLDNNTDKAVAVSLRKYKNQLLARKKVLEQLNGQGDFDSGKEQKFYADPKTSGEYAKNIDYYSKMLTDEDTKEQRRLRVQIQLWKRKRDEIELAKKAAQVPAELNTAKDVDAALEYLKAKRELAGADELAGIDKEISKTELRGLEIQRPQNIGMSSTAEEIDREIAYQQKLKATSEGATDAIDKEIRRLDRLKDTRTELQIMQDALSDVQKEFDNATTVEAKVRAGARVDELQREIDEATKGRLTIEAETEPTYTVRGSLADKRKSYANAQTRASRIEEDYKIGLIDATEARRQVEDLNRQLESLGKGLKPIEIEIDSKRLERAMGGVRDAWGGLKGIGNGIAGIRDACEESADAWESMTGVIDGFLSIAEGVTSIVELTGLLTGATRAQTAAKAAEAVAETRDAGVKATAAAATAPLIVANKALTASFMEAAAASYFAAHAYIPFAGFAIAEGFVTAATAATKMAGVMAGAFASGGIVPGTQWAGDKVLARVNSGEMILNAQQQARLFALANGAAVYGEALGIGSEWRGGLKPQEVKAQLAKLQRLAVEGQTGGEQRIRLRVRGRDLVETAGNELRSTRRRSNLR